MIHVQQKLFFLNSHCTLLCSLINTSLFFLRWHLDLCTLALHSHDHELGRLPAREVLNDRVYCSSPRSFVKHVFHPSPQAPLGPRGASSLKEEYDPHGSLLQLAARPAHPPCRSKQTYCPHQRHDHPLDKPIRRLSPGQPDTIKPGCYDKVTILDLDLDLKLEPNPSTNF